MIQCLDKLDRKQIKLLKCLKTLGIYFIPFTVDGNWDYADNIKVLDIKELFLTLQQCNAWGYDVSQCSLDYTVYMLEITLNSEPLKRGILYPFQKFKSQYWDIEIKSNITLYLRYSDMCKLYRRGCIERKKKVFYVSKLLYFKKRGSYGKRKIKKNNEICSVADSITFCNYS